MTEREEDILRDRVTVEGPGGGTQDLYRVPNSSILAPLSAIRRLLSREGGKKKKKEKKRSKTK